jgi:hypothetical protein
VARALTSRVAGIAANALLLSLVLLPPAGASSLTGHLWLGL